MNFNELFKIVEESSAVRSYSCLMLDLSELQQDINEMHEGICPCDVYDDEPGHGLQTDEFHATVKYGLHTDKAKEVFDVIKLYPVKLKFKSLSLFENEKFDVLKFDIVSKDLRAINKEVSEKLECTDSYPNYHPHSTVCYCRPGTGKHYTKLGKHLIGKEFTSNKFLFSNKMSDKVIINVG